MRKDQIAWHNPAIRSDLIQIMREHSTRLSEQECAEMLDLCALAAYRLLDKKVRYE